MPKHETIRILQTDLLAHPAVQAWRELQSVRVEPERIEILKGRLPDQTARKNRFVCRLVGVGPTGSAVIGKRCRLRHAVIESTIYDDILPYLPIPSLNFYGMVEDANGDYCWLFLEDAGEEAYSAHVAEHRTLSAQWLGLVHTSATPVTAPACLPDKGPKHYLNRLQSARDTILRQLVNHALQAHNLAPLEAIVYQYDVLESHWDQVAEFCDGIPQTLVHGDFAARNLRVRRSQDGMELLTFDWGEAGWGVPATDVRAEDVAAYWSVVRKYWPWLNVQAIQRLAIVGKIFRSLDAIYWELFSFKYAYPWLKRSMSIYQSSLAEAIRAAGFEG